MKNPFSLSTSWNSTKHDNGFDIVDEIRSIGFDTIELGFAMTKRMVDDIGSLKDKGIINVSSLHNACPLPDGIEPKKASPDYYSLASIVEEERAKAVQVTKNTIDHAKRLGAKAVILHAGRVDIKDRTRELAASFDDRPKFEKIKRQMVEERSEKGSGHFESVLKSLDELVPYSVKAGVALAVETRYYYREIPTLEEFEAIFRRYPKEGLHYWHDCGHAEVFERLGLTSHKSFLDNFSGRLIGVHLHDIIGLIQDHNAPGAGTFDFTMLKPYIKHDTIKVIEAHQPATADDIRRSISLLSKIFA